MRRPARKPLTPLYRLVGVPKLEQVFSPSDISGLTAWYDFSDIDTLYQDSSKTTPVASDADPIGAVADKSGGARDVLQVGADSTRPTYKTDIKNGLSIGRFDGGDYLQSSAWSELSQPNTIIAVFKNTTLATTRFVYAGLSATKRQSLYTDNSSNYTIVAGSAGAVSGVSADTLNYYYVTSIYNGASSTFRRNGTAYTVADCGSEGMTGITLGANYNASSFFSGDMCELLVYDSALSEEDYANVESYLAHKWGIITTAENFAITSPVSYQVFQRNGSGKANISITGTYSGTPASIEARFNGSFWQTIDSSPSGGTFSGTLTNQDQGMGPVEVRDPDNPDDSAMVLYVGIGDVFLVAGQSNAGGQGTNNQSYSHNWLKAGLFGNDYSWGELTDPTDDNTGQVDTVSSDVAFGGSVWPLIATSYLANQGVPVAFIPCALTTTSMNDWLPGADHLNRSTLYGSMNYRGQNYGGSGVKAVLMWQGERDANLGTSEATYNSELDTFANAVNTDLGCKVIIAKIHDTPYTETNVWNAIDTAVGDNANVLAGPDLSDLTTSPDNLHFTTDAEMSTAAGRWWTAIKNAFGW